MTDTSNALAFLLGTDPVATMKALRAEFDAGNITWTQLMTATTTLAVTQVPELSGRK